MRALSVTFGRTPKPHVYQSVFSKDIQDFIRYIPFSKDSFVNPLTLPLLRTALIVHASRHSLNGTGLLSPLNLKHFAMLDFNANEWRYTVSGSSKQYEVKIDSNSLNDKFFHIRVSIPHKQLGGKKLSDKWLFDNPMTGFDFYHLESDEIKKLKALQMDKPTYMRVQYKHNDDSGEDSVSSNFKRLKSSVAYHEAYWNGLVEGLLCQIGVPYQKRSLKTDECLFIEPKFKTRGLELRNDFMGVCADEVAQSGQFHIKYFVDSKALINIKDVGEVIQYIETEMGALKADSLKNDELTNLSFERVNTFDDADLVFGTYDTECRWDISSDDSVLDEYGRHKLAHLKNGILCTKQFVSIDGEVNVSTLQRAISELYLKAWLSEKNCRRDVNLLLQPKSQTTTITVLMTKMFKVKEPLAVVEEEKRVNLFHCCVEIVLESKSMTVRQPQIFTEMGITKPLARLEGGEFLNCYFPLSDNKLSYLKPILENLEDIKDFDVVENSLDQTLFKNDRAIIFEHDNGDLRSLWTTNTSDLFLVPDLEFDVNNPPTFEEFIKNGVRKNHFTKGKQYGRIDQNQRRTTTPHYEFNFDSNRLFVHRRLFNPSQAISRHIVRDFMRVYPVEHLNTIEDCIPITCSLLTPDVGAYKDSGISETLYEKIFSLIM